MASAVELQDLSTQLQEEQLLACSYCRVLINAMPSPRRLPYQHILCRQCLSVASEKAGSIVCRHCDSGHGTELKIENLPLDFELHYTCQPCSKRGQVNKAGILCRTCPQNAQKFCPKHIESHNDVFDDHDLVELKGLPENMKRVNEKCGSHPEHMLTLGCARCLIPMCIYCTDVEGQCCNSKEPHKPKPIEKVGELMKPKLRALVGQLEERSERLADLTESIKDIQVDLKTNHREHLHLLQQTRDAHISEITRKYNDMEQDLVTRYKEAETDVIRYADVSLHEQNKSVLSLVNSLNRVAVSQNQMEVVDLGYRLREEGQMIVKSELPSLVMRRKSLNKLEMRREMELELKDLEPVSLPQRLDPVRPEAAPAGDMGAACPACPTRLVHSRQTKLYNSCYTVREFRGAVYVGVSGGDVNVVRDDICRLFTSLDGGWVFSMQMHKGNMYLLHLYTTHSKDRWCVRVCDRRGRQIHTWSHRDVTSCLFSYSNKLVIYKDRVYIPDRTSNKITVYSLVGCKVASIDCALERKDDTALTVTALGRLIVSQWKSGVVKCLCVETKNTVWKIRLDKPTSVTTDSSTGLIYVATGGCSKSLNIKVLSPDKGKELAAFRADGLFKEDAFFSDMWISNNTIYATRDEILYQYRLES